MNKYRVVLTETRVYKVEYEVLANDEEEAAKRAEWGEVAALSVDYYDTLDTSPTTVVLVSENRNSKEQQ